MLKIIFLKIYIILIYFQTKNTLNTNHNHIIETRKNIISIYISWDLFNLTS